jgi:metallo-beta-lactamase family protein
MKVQFVGAAGTVTGSMHLVRTEKATILLECGLFQGRRREAMERNRNLRIPVRELSAVVLSHAHIDHSGALPLLYAQGYRGPIFATPATRDLCAAMLEDAAMIQAQDAAYVNKLAERGEPGVEPVEPLYDMRDVTGVLSLMQGVPYRRLEHIAPGVDLTFYDAGHVLGSAQVALDVDEVGETRRLVFSGDLGRHRVPILRDPEVPEGAHALLLESTYGDRSHAPIERLDEDLARVVTRTVERGGKVIVPSFALERAQEVIFTLKRLRKDKRIPEVPVFVDSPLTVKVTDVFRLHPDCYDEEMRALMAEGESPFDFEGLQYVSEVADSKALDARPSSAIIISASGMCESGRVLHHLKSALGSDKNAVVIVGFQAPHTLGRRLVEGRTRVRVFGVEQERRAEVVVLDGFSAHADRDGLVAHAEAMRERGPLRHVALVHGEPQAREGLQRTLLERGFPAVHVPQSGDEMVC